VNYPDFFGKLVKIIGRNTATILTSEKDETTQTSELSQSEVSES